MVYITERLTGLDTVQFEYPIDEAVFRILKTMVEFRMGKEKAERNISQVIQMGIYPEKAALFNAVFYAYISYDDELFFSGDTSEEKRREEAEVLLGKALQQSREQSRLTVQDIAQQVGLKTSEVMSLEEGSLVLPDLATVLGIEEIRKTLPGNLKNLIRETETPAN